ncbi:cytolethal distending toxin subunit B family protein [Helicobacter pametensis]|uniref:cytolethal distending toxin subunit B family protein n=1 Tax=Helicobacter pametensis TaxID=95149 RepID=UPI0004833974|nr:cytolethal distending toxin subunit B family protein [Helicobacter pametensis]
MKRIFILCTLVFDFVFGGLENYRVGTWNLQGSSALTENKWNISVRQLITGENPVDILMLQEAGRPPNTAVSTGRVFDVGIPLREYTWELGTSSRPNMVYIYHADLDVGARRVNLAIVSNRRADSVIVIHQTVIAPERSRPALGIRIGDDAFFNIHAFARGGGDSGALVTAIHDHFNLEPNVEWMVAGDFNRNPATLSAGLDRRILHNIRILATNSATHSSSSADRVLDYGIIGRTTQAPSAPTLPAIVAILMSASVRSYLASDHFPVRFGRF